MAEKVTESKAGKAGIIAVAIVAVAGAIFMGVKSLGGGGQQTANPAEVQSDAQKAVDVIKNNPNIPEKQKQEMLAHYEGMAQGGANKGAATPPPTGGGGQ